MLGTLADGLAAARKPEYTGENRCLPCTVVNGVIAVVAAVVLAAIVPAEPRGSIAIGGIVLLASATLIYLRGYLVPGTPRLTKSYLPDWILRRFDDHHPTTADAGGEIDPASVLEAAGAVAECDDVDDLCLTADFRAAWNAEIGGLEVDATRADLAGMLGLDDEALTFEHHGRAFVALADGGVVDTTGPPGRRRVGQWESEGAFLADMAAERVLSDRYDGWDPLPATRRGRVLNGLRIFLDACPSCGGPVTFGEEVVESCCRSREVVAVTCEDCGDRLFEADQPETS